MTDTRETPSTGKRRKLTDAEKEKIRDAIRERYGNQKLYTPALLFRLGSMLLIILFSIGIIINLKRRASQGEHVSRKPRVVISIESQGAGTEKAVETPVSEPTPSAAKSE